MRIDWHVCLATLGLIAVLGPGRPAAEAADVRTMMAAQRQLRAELLAAMSDGDLDQRERHRLERDAADKLSPEALGAFRRMLDRVQGPASPPAQGGSSGQIRQPALQPDRDGTQFASGPVVVMKQAASEVEGPEFPNLERESKLDAPEVAVLVQATMEEPAGEGRTVAVPADPYGEPGGARLRTVSMLAEPVPDDAPVFEGSCGVVSEEMGCGGCCDGVCEPSGMACLDWIQFSSSVDAFQGPMDLDGLNANYGMRFAVNGALPLSRRFGIGAQAGTSAVIADVHGTQFTGSRERTQNFTTVGVFQRICFGSGAVKYGCAFDWLFDEYYASFTMSQWRAKLGWEVSPATEVGLWSTIPNDGDHALLPAVDPQVPTLNAFKPFAQGSLYWEQCWGNGTTTTAFVGIADEPGAWVFGSNARIPMGARLAFLGNFHCIAPSAEGVPAQEEEVWNVSVGLEWTPGACVNRCRTGKFRPLFRLADNGLFAVRRY
jgi:hypothetical protein